MSQLLDIPVDTKLKLSALWVAASFGWIYAMLLRLYVPGALESIGSLTSSTDKSGMWMGASIVQLVPILMIFLSLALSAKHSRTLNIVVGSSFVLMLSANRILKVLLASLPDHAATASFPAREAAVLLETASLLIVALAVWLAWNWPKSPRGVQ